MKIVVQRVKEASVEIGNEISGTINTGLLIFLGIENEDGQEDINWLVKKIINLRVFPDDEDKMNLSLKDIEGELLVVSQFTLHASLKREIDLVLRSLPSQSWPKNYTMIS